MIRVLRILVIGCEVCVLVCIAGVFLSEWELVHMDESIFHGTVLILAPLIFVSSGLFLYLSRGGGGGRKASSDGDDSGSRFTDWLVRLGHYGAGAYLAWLLLLGVVGAFALDDF